MPRCASSCVCASRPISITKTSETKWTLLEKPNSMLHCSFQYLRMCLTARKSALVGAWKCWQTLFTACAISGLVKVKYWRDPISCLYRVGSISCSSEGVMMDLRAMGVLIWVHSIIFVCSRRYLVYFVWEKNNLLGRYLTSNPKKIMQRSLVLERKFTTQGADEVTNYVVIIACDYNIINIDK